jgi:DNA-binding SARP family transcriptional activator
MIMARLAVSLLGTFQVVLHGKPVTAFETDKARGLLAYLMVEADRPHPRERLAGMLWPDSSEEAAHNSLRQALHNLRRALGEPDPAAPFLLLTPGSVQFNMASDCWLDVTAFGDRVAACRRHPHAQLESCPVCTESLEEALALYRGDFLGGLKVANSAAYEEWTLYWREYLHRLALESMVHLSNYYERLPDLEQAWRWAERQLQMEPWREEAHRQLMRVMARLGQRSAALARRQARRRPRLRHPGRDSLPAHVPVLRSPGRRS